MLVLKWGFFCASLFFQFSVVGDIGEEFIGVVFEVDVAAVVVEAV